jgi:hypothetical protein
MRKYLGIKCDKEEKDSINLINNRLSCADQALNVSNIHLIEDPSPEAKAFAEEQGKIFVKGAIEYKAQAQFLLNDWWETVREVYNLPENAQIDTKTYEFFIPN